MTDKEKELLVGCLRGDQAAWNDFVRQDSGLIYHRVKKTLTLHRLDPAQHLVDDVFQEIFLSLVKDDFAQLRRFRGDHNCTLASWLRTKTKVEALRQAQLELIRGKVNHELLVQRGVGGVGKLGQTVAVKSPSQNSISISHPYFWAPFILVGDTK
jgi:hypothetical protein